MKLKKTFFQKKKMSNENKTYFRWRPFCGGDLVLYALKLKKQGEFVILKDLYKEVAKHALLHYGVTPAVISGPESPSDLVKNIVKVSCMVRSSDRWKSEVEYVSDPAVFAKPLKEAIEFSKNLTEEAMKAKERDIYVAHGCHTDGSVYLEKHYTPAGSLRPHRRVFFYTGPLHQLVCGFVSDDSATSDHLEGLYDLLSHASNSNSENLESSIESSLASPSSSEEMGESYEEWARRKAEDY